MFPTVIRNTALGVGSMCARLSAALTPLITLLVYVSLFIVYDSLPPFYENKSLFYVYKNMSYII